METDKRAREIKHKRWPPYVITFVVLAVVTLLLAWAAGALADTDPEILSYLNITKEQYRILKWCNAFCVSGVFCLFFGMSLFIKYGSIIEIIVSCAKRIATFFREDRIDRKYRRYSKDKYPDYKPRPYRYFLLIGSVYLLVGIVLMVVYSKTLHG